MVFAKITRQGKSGFNPRERRAVDERVWVMALVAQPMEALQGGREGEAPPWRPSPRPGCRGCWLTDDVSLLTGPHRGEGRRGALWGLLF